MSSAALAERSAKLDALPPGDRLLLVKEELKRRAYLAQPDLWIERRLKEHLWSKQREIIRTVARERNTLAVTCHNIGKSWIASRAAGWWLDNHKVGTAFVVTSAPSAPQIKAILWREISRVHSAGNLDGRVNQTEWFMDLPTGKEELVAFGRKPDDYNPAAFQGIHARYILVILDEANGIRGPLHEAAGSLVSNDYGKMLMIGNPDDPSGEFFEAATDPKSGWAVIQVGAFDTPNFTGEEIHEGLRHDLIGRIYVEEKRKKWSPSWKWVDKDGADSTPSEGVCVVPPKDHKSENTNPFWSSKVLGQFPIIIAEQALINITWIKAAQARTIVPADEPDIIGVDVGAGGDASVGCRRQGGHFRILWEDHNPDTMQTCGKVIQFVETTGATKAQVDLIGIGKGVVDRAREQKKEVYGVNVAEAADDPKRYKNQRAELYWGLRVMFERGLVDLDPEDEDLAAELASMRYEPTSSGQIQIESKKQAKARGVPSPNRAEAMMLSTATIRKKYTTATWGARK